VRGGKTGGPKGEKRGSTGDPKGREGGREGMGSLIALGSLIKFWALKGLPFKNRKTVQK
jgi:hypothetical protein